MIVHLDTSALIDAIGGGPCRTILKNALSDRHRLHLSSLVLFEWLRGPRTEAEIRFQDALFPAEATIVFGSTEAALAATLHRTVRRPRGREIDLAIAACAIVQGAALWTLNTEDFDDVPGLRLFAGRHAP
jgi:predicted nucleic acid-binding protein